MKKITCIATLLAASLSFGQNLATNGDFESSNPYDNVAHGQPTDDPSLLSTNYIDDTYFKRAKNNKYGFIEETDPSFIQGTRGAKLPVDSGMHIRYGVHSILTPGVTYTVKIDFLALEGALYNKAFNFNYYQATNKNLGSIGSNYKPTVGWTTWTGEFKYGDLATYPEYDALDTKQYIHFSIAQGTQTTATYIDNLQFVILACVDEGIELEVDGTSALSIYANDVNNGVPVAIGSNANLTSATFYEADGTTNADAKFTLNPDGTITAISASEDTDYKLTYKLTSTGDADSSGTNDWDEITQTIRIAAPIVYLPEKNVFSFDTDDDLEGWVDNTFVGAPTVVSGGAMTVTLPPLPVDINTPLKTILDHTGTSVNPQNNDYVYIRYQNNSDNETFRFQMTNNSGENQGYVIDNGTDFKINTTGYEVLQIHLAAQSKWSTAINATNFQMQVRNEVLQANDGYIGDITSPGTFIVDQIVFSSLPTWEEVEEELSIDNIIKEDASIALYPNPVNAVLNIQSNNEIDSVTICNAVGQNVLIHNSSAMDVSHLPKGIYICIIQQSNGNISTKRFVKN